MYIELNEKIEQMSRLLYVVTVKLTIPGSILPAVFITAINYFLYDLGDESFFSPFFVMYVFCQTLEGKLFFSLSIDFCSFLGCHSIRKHRAVMLSARLSNR